MALNQMQQQAVQHTEGPLLILAGAGSGKTTVLVNRVQHIIADGYALPWQVLAITFTNKAAGEIRQRLADAIGPGGGVHLGPHLPLLLRADLAPVWGSAGLYQPLYHL
mgnify:CR=1 FL=1